MTETTMGRKPGLRLIAILAAAAVIVGAGVAVGANRAYGAETSRQCGAALQAGEKAATRASKANKAADVTLKAITSTTLPGGKGWKSTSYAAHPAVAAVAATSARPSGVDFIKAVGNDKLDLAALHAEKTCGDRAAAKAITATAAKTRQASSQLSLDTSALAIDFATFQKDETARVAAEVAATKKKAEAEAAAKKAAAEAAAKAAAAAEAARVAAARQASPVKSYTGGTSSSRGGSTPPVARSTPPGAGTLGGDIGGGVVPPGGYGCVVSNGHGGTMPCP
ncbi:hypothetical protein GCM10025867_51290 (plasmid) [Frondihabitans sucicola]|uniref:Colicin transporter n=1 Tax=Frondihabitans sucicola TaxID=1268041 RepID=A0ABM8GVB2_9MICO|nr:hypothetical protein [Frondihabitans sucicola]BDZ52320.1 hypothetical protein GCM10025867_45610 [Frondihabitans sucicola]BDZ52888.1 hypothetical protein GCM10025867_51290 [Frondihabitans sucicola]